MITLIEIQAQLKEQKACELLQLWVAHLIKHDAFYRYSDDYSVYLEGEKSEDKLHALAANLSYSQFMNACVFIKTGGQLAYRYDGYVCESMEQAQQVVEDFLTPVEVIFTHEECPF
jgi:hypothetical protein